MGTVVAGKWYLMAGLDTKTNKPLGAVYVFDPANNAWTARKAMPVAAHHIMTAALGGKIYVFGGFVSPPNVAAWKPTDHTAVYDPVKDEWQDLAPLPTPRGAGWAVELNGKLYVVGGAQANARGNPPLHSSQAPRSWF